MKWLLFVFDPENRINKLELYKLDEIKKSLDKFTNKKLDVHIGIFDQLEYNVGQLINNYIDEAKGGKFDHICLVYDGNSWADGIANNAFYTLSYNKENINHHTANLIDEYLTTEYKEGNGVALVAESLYKLYWRFATDFSYPTDAGTLEEKKALIEQLKNYF